MKLLKRTITGMSLAGLLALAGPSALAQDAPATPGQDVPAEAQDASAGRTPATPEAAALPDGAAPAADAQQERTNMIEAIRSEGGLPPQRDTGFMPGNNPWLQPQSASTIAPGTDGVLWYIHWVTIIFTILILGVMIYFVIRYRSRGPDEPDPENVATHSTTLELTWTIIPLCIVLIMFALGFRDFLNQAIVPPNAPRINVHAQMWSWSFTYPNGAVTEDLHLAVGQPVQFAMSSQDVLHSFFVPAFRIKKDVVPGRFNSLWVEPTEEGIFEIFCTEYCGTNHSRMIAKVFVYTPERYDEILNRISDIYRKFPSGELRTPEEIGERLWSTRGCRGCHSVDGSILQGPSWRNLYGSSRNFADGTSAVADETYIQESILRPQARLVVGFPASMPSYSGQLSEEDIGYITAYMRSLSDNARRVQDGEVVGPGESQSLPGQPPLDQPRE